MKRFFCIIVLATICFGTSFGQKSFDSGQQAVRDNIMSFLREEGYQPSIDSDGDIKFKRQGDVYFVIVSVKDSSPYYVRLTKFFSYGERITRTNINRYADEINQYKMIKLSADDDSFSLEAQMYLINSVSFTSIFNKILAVMDGAESELK